MMMNYSSEHMIALPAAVSRELSLLPALLLLPRCG